MGGEPCPARDRPLRPAGRGRLLAWLPYLWGEQSAFLFHPSGRFAVICDGSTFWRWPLVARAPGVLRLGPPEELPVAVRGSLHCAALGGGRAVVFFQRDEGWVFDLETGETRSVQGRHRNPRGTSVSPAGDWVAAGNWGGDGVKVWRAADGALERAFSGAGAAFSPDGRRLVVWDTAEYRFHETGTWRLRRRLEKESAAALELCAFSPGGRFVALGSDHAHVDLVDPETGRRLVRLEAPDALAPWDRACFSPDGLRLIVATPHHAVQVWDLGFIGERFAALGLDSGLPRLASRAGDPARAPEALLVSSCERSETRTREDLVRLERIRSLFDGDPEYLHELGHTLESLGRLREALAAFSRALELDPESARILAHRGRVLSALERPGEADGGPVARGTGRRPGS